MALLFMDGFDKYGGTSTSITSVAALMAGEWTSLAGNLNIVAPLSATGQAIQTTASSGTNSKTLAANYGRIIGGIRFSSNLVNTAGIQFTDAGTVQCSISIATTGVISFRNAGFSTGTILGSSSAISANTTHYLEWDITLGNSAAYNIYLDGVSVISGTGDTTATANNTINGFNLTTNASAVITYDDLYFFDTTGVTNNAVLLTSPRIETQLPNADSAVQFAIGASVLGATVARSVATYAPAANNNWYVRPFTPSRACTLNSLTLMANASNASVQLRPIVYADSAGIPGTLMSAGSTVVGQIAGTPIVMPLTTPQSLVAGTQYWLGWMVDIQVASGYQVGDGSLAGRTQTGVTFGSGAPSTPPGSQVTGQASVLLWGNITLASAANYYQVNQQPPPAPNTSYLTDTVVNHEDLYNFPSLSVVPLNVYAVAVKGWCSRSDTGARSVSLRVKSGAMDGGGSLTGQTPASSLSWLGTNFDRDPNGNITWTGAALNAAQSGFKIDT